MAVPYYNVGTATLTAGSTAMVGQGTLWVGNVRPGDVVYPKAGGPNIAATIIDNTHITLLLASTVTQAAQPYAVLYTPDDPFTQTLARQVLQAVSGSALVGLGSLAPTARMMPYFDATGAASLTALSDFARTLNAGASAEAVLTSLAIGGQSDAPLRLRREGNDIEFGHPNSAGYGSTLGSEVVGGSPSLLFFGEAGTNVNTYRTRGRAGIGVRGRPGDSGLDFIRVPNANADNQTATVIASLDPDGSFRQGGDKIVERGTNANGSYLRFVDGTQICTSFIASRSVSVTTSAGALYVSPGQSATYPASFASVDYAGAVESFGIGGQISTTTSTISWLIFGGNSSIASTKCGILAIGKWK